MGSGSNPPAGWYADPYQAGRERWWGGDSWGEQYRTPNAVPPIAAAQPATVAMPPSSQVVCPRCASAANVRLIGPLIAEGTVKTTGTAGTTTTTSGSVYIGTEIGMVHGSSHSQTSINATSMSETVRSLRWPDGPAFSRKWFGRWYLVLTAAAGTLLLLIDSRDQSPVGVMVPAYLIAALVMWLPALVIFLIQRAVTAPGRALARAAWERGVRRLCAAYFCTHDGVVIENGQAYVPSAYKAMVFGR